MKIRSGTIKIDGLREPEHAVTAAKAGVDMIGFIFAPTHAGNCARCLVERLADLFFPDGDLD